MFGAMTSLTGGGGLNMASSASADGDNTFANAFNYKGNSNGNSNEQLLIVGGLALIAIFLIKGVK